MCICQVLCIRPNRLYIVKYRSSRTMSSFEYQSQNHQSTSSMACHLSSWNATAQSNSFWQRASILNGQTFLTGCVLCFSQAVCFVYRCSYQTFLTCSLVDSMLPKKRPQYVQTRSMSASFVEGQE